MSENLRLLAPYVGLRCEARLGSGLDTIDSLRQTVPTGCDPGGTTLSSSMELARIGRSTRIGSTCVAILNSQFVFPRGEGSRWDNLSRVTRNRLRRKAFATHLVCSVGDRVGPLGLISRVVSPSVDAAESLPRIDTSSLESDLIQFGLVG